jgi:hypothetical protein
MMSMTGCAPSATEIARDQQKTEVSAEERKQIVQAVTNLEPIGQHLEATGRKPEGKAVGSQTAVIENAMAIKPEEKTPPTVSFLQWQLAKDDVAKAEGLAAQLEGEKKALGSELEEKRKKLDDLEKAVAEENNSIWSWAKLGGFGLSALGVAAWVGRMLNVPGMQFVEPLIASFAPAIKRRAEDAERKASTAATAVIASDVGSFALLQLQNTLMKLDPDLKQRLPELIAKATNGKAESIQEVFKMVAKGVAVDEGKQVEVKALLETLRNDDAMPTTLGQPTAVTNFFAAN